ALAVALAATGCVDFTELTVVGGQEPARLQLTLRLVQDSTVCRGGCVLSDGTAVSPGPGGIVAWFDARLRPGADAGGVPRGVADETLVVLGRPFEPVDRSLLGERRYEGVLALEEAGVEEVTLTFTPPEVEGVGARIPAVRWRVPGALGPDTLIVRPGEDLTLRLAMPAQESEPPFQFGTWAVAVAGQPPLRISSTGAPPEEVRIPHYYLPEAPALFPVLFDIFTGATFFPDPGDYVVAVVVDLKLDWTVRLAADTAASAVLPPTGMPAWTTRTR
ncbi:MAG TPA: hypothetical protein VMK65_01880, partial [Longimicrobiales bacterium]|nr:hypothetical protein [Longimicrobiales bacterium]